MINLYSELKTHIPLTLEDITSKGRKYTTVSIDIKEIRNLPDLINLWNYSPSRPGPGRAEKN